MFKTTTLLIASIAMVVSAVNARADQWDKKTVITFSQPVELPNIVLPAGTYVFKLANTQGTRSVVHVFNQEESQIFTTLLAIPHLHAQPHDKTYIGFEERRTGTPQAIHEWFYPGSVNGLEFVYPKARAQELARETRQPVLAAEVKPSESPAELEQEIVVEITPENREIPVEQAFDPALVAPADAEPDAALAPTGGAAHELPKTATEAGLFMLLGAGALALAAMVRAIRVNSN